MPVPQGYQAVSGSQGVSCMQKLKMGFLMGAVIGGSTGVLIDRQSGSPIWRFFWCIYDCRSGHSLLTLRRRRVHHTSALHCSWADVDDDGQV
uniref:Reactive oxygen species modulator 1 n=1 Tax=Ditylenchus dipsaci TaxID=166011 RepID=A0A915DAL4_9BILA